MLANARKDHSSPLLLVPSIFLLKSPFPRKLNNVVLVCTLIPRPSNTSCKSLIYVSTYRVQISLPAALRLLWVLIIPNLLLLLCCVDAQHRGFFYWAFIGRYGGGVIGSWCKPIRSEVYQEPITSPPITPPGKLSFDWLRRIQDYKKCKFDPKMEWNAFNSINCRPTLGP